VKNIRDTSYQYSLVVVIAAMVVFIAFALSVPSDFRRYWADILLAASVVVWLAHYRLQFEHYQATLSHALILTLGLSIGTLPALIALTSGLLVYSIIDLFRNRRYQGAGFHREGSLTQWLVIWGRQVLPSTLGLGLYSWLGGRLTSEPGILPSFWPFIGCVVGFSMVYLALHWLDPMERRHQQNNRREVIALITITLAPAPIVLLAATAFGFLRTASFLIYCVILAIAAPIFKSLTQMEIKLRQRAEALGLLSELTSPLISSYDPDVIFKLILNTSISIGCGDLCLINTFAPSGLEGGTDQSINISNEMKSRWSAFLLEHEGHTSGSDKMEAFYFDRLDESDLPLALATLLSDEGVVSLACLPLYASQALLGRLTIFSSEPMNYSNRRRELLTLFASQAAFALSNALAHAIADRTLSIQSEQLSRLEEINRQLTASSVSDNLYEIILDHAIQATSADWGYLALHRAETGCLHLVAYQNDPNNLKEFESEPGFSVEQGIFGRAFRTGQLLNVQKSTEDVDAVDPLGTNAESVLCVPLCGPEAMLGVIGVESSKPQAFNQAQEQFLLQLSAYAANALHHAHIYHELQNRLTEQSLLYQASTQIAESLESDAVGMAIADSLRVAVQSDTASVYRWVEDDQFLTLLARIDEGRPSRKGQSNPDIKTLLGHAQCIKDRVSMQWSSDEEVSQAERDYLHENYGKGRLLLLPLCIGERTLGIVEIFRKDPIPFKENAIRSAQSIVIQASIALENTDLFNKISQSHNRLLAVLNSTREGILLIDMEGTILIANRQIESMIGIKPEDLLQLPIDDPSLDLDSHLGYNPTDLQQLAFSLKNGRAQLAGTATFKDTTKTYFRIDTPVYDSTDQLIGWLISVRDISEQKEIEETREQLTEMIVHDLRSPLTAILNSLLLLRRELNDDKTSSVVEQAIVVADRSVNQMLGLVNSLLDISRLESGKLKISTEDVRIRPLMMELRDRFQLEANTIGIILKTDFEKAEIHGHIDREKIQRVIANLLDNAIKFTPVGGEIELGYTKKDHEIYIWVSDTGPGIPNEFQEKIFERYIQIPGSTGRRRGTGLGLAFAKLAVEAHQGRLWVEQNPLGGSVFIISLPIKSAS
jgi:NtrC-family two-component system sensor histidine kinase KinB